MTREVTPWFKPEGYHRCCNRADPCFRRAAVDPDTDLVAKLRGDAHYQVHILVNSQET
jgi:hypothetical protein